MVFPGFSFLELGNYACVTLSKGSFLTITGSQRVVASNQEGGGGGGGGGVVASSS